ncbi:MAG: ATP-binding protein [Thermoguttaceae bacterium]|nr:ATP-binding protein [Thermoguttaceae bacterium]
MTVHWKEKRVEKMEFPQAVARNAAKKERWGEDDSENRNSVAFIPRAPIYHPEDMVLNQNVLDQVQIMLSRIRNHKTLYEIWGLEKIDPQGKHFAVSFYGPPGTGKTMCAEALAMELGREIIEVNYTEIESKYVGETGKNIRKAFEAASKTGAILFFDEADAVLGHRMENVTQAADHAVDVARAVMLKELDRFDGIVVFATNKFEKFDRAFTRRILQHVEIGLPDYNARVRLWKHFVQPKIPGRDTLNWDKLAEASEGLSGGDIKSAVILACSAALMDPTERNGFLAQCDETSSVPTSCEKVLTQELCLTAVERIINSQIASGNRPVKVIEKDSLEDD